MRKVAWILLIGFQRLFTSMLGADDGLGKDKEEEKPKSPHTFSASVSFVSDYRFRGISQTMREPAIQGTMDYSHKSGIYLGTFGSNVDGTSHFYNNTSMEWDWYGGYKGKIFPCIHPDFTYNIGLIYYYYPGGKAKIQQSNHYNTGELYIELTYKWISLKCSNSLTNYFGINSHNTPFNYHTNTSNRSNSSSKGSIYVEGNINLDIYEKANWNLWCITGGKLNLLLHCGHQTVRNYGHLSYTDWKATLTQDLDWFSLFFTYIGTNANHAYYDVPDNAYHSKKKHLGSQGVVLGVIKSF
jgi:uncharacterized protein (TIGR02001 family)